MEVEGGAKLGFLLVDQVTDPRHRAIRDGPAEILSGVQPRRRDGRTEGLRRAGRIGGARGVEDIAPLLRWRSSRPGGCGRRWRGPRAAAALLKAEFHVFLEFPHLILELPVLVLQLLELPRKLSELAFETVEANDRIRGVLRSGGNGECGQKGKRSKQATKHGGSPCRSWSRADNT